MPDSFIAIDEPATVDKKLDTFQQTVGANVVERERVILAGEGATDFSLPVAHDAADAGNPLKIGGKASAAAPADVSADADRVNAWFLRNGAQAAVITAAGALIGGDATNGLDVDVTRVQGTVAVTQSGTWDEVGINDSGNSITVDNPALSVVGGGAEATALRVTVANDSTGVLSVDDNGGALTVDNAGTFAVQESGSWIQVDDAAFTPATSKVAMVGAEFDDTAPDSVDEGDGGALRMSANRNLYVQIRDAAGNERGLNVDASGAVAITHAALTELAAAINVSSQMDVNIAASAATVPVSNADLAVMGGWDNAASDGASVSGDVAHDGADAGEPVKVGFRAIAHGANPTAVAAADRTNWYGTRHGIPFVHNGHPFIKSAVYLTTGAQTDDNVLPAIASGTKYVIVGYSILLDSDTTAAPAIRIGFGATTVPTLPTSGSDAVDGLLEYHPGMVAGTGIAIQQCYLPGGDGEELRVTCDAPTGGTFVIRVWYYTIES